MFSEIRDVAWSVKRLQWRHNRTANRRLSNLGLSLVQWDVLRNIQDRPDASLHALAESTFQTDPSMNELANRMVRRDLIERVPGPGRSVVHRLTDTGRSAFEAGALAMAETLTDTLGRLTPVELATLHDLVRKSLGEPSSPPHTPDPSGSHPVSESELQPQ